MGRGIAKSEAQASRQAFRKLKARSHDPQPPALASDGGGGYRATLVELYGRPAPRNPAGGRWPSRLLPGADWQYLQVVKHRRNHRLTRVEPRVVFGDPLQVRTTLGQHTAYVERTHLTSRLMSARLTRRSLAFSKSLQMLCASACWEDLVYNFVRPLKSLRQPIDHPVRRWFPRSPALAAGLTDHLWSIEQVLSSVLVLINYQ